MPMKFKDGIMQSLKAAGWSEYRIRKENKLSAATIKSIKSGFANINMRSLEQICEMLGGVQPNEVIEYAPLSASQPNPRLKTAKRVELVGKITEEWFAQGKPAGSDLDAHIRKCLQESGLL